MSEGLVLVFAPRDRRREEGLAAMWCTDSLPMEDRSDARSGTLEPPVEAEAHAFREIRYEPVQDAIARGTLGEVEQAITAAFARIAFDAAEPEPADEREQ